MEKLNRLQSGIEGLDALLKGGLVSGASYIIQGRPGSGKTILANQLGFHHARNGGRVLVATLLAESHDRLFQFLSTLSFFDASRVGAEIQFVSAFDTLENEGLDEVVKLLRREISRQKATVMVVDGLLNARSKADSPIDTKKFISELQGHAAFAGCTVLFLTSLSVFLFSGWIAAGLPVRVRGMRVLHHHLELFHAFGMGLGEIELFAGVSG